MVAHNSSEPMYRQIKNQIIHDIDAGIYGVGDKLPSEREMCEKYGVSRIPVRKALEHLELQGIIHSVQGKGSFVSSPMINDNLTQLSSFSETLSQMGYEGRTEIVSFEPHSTDHSVDMMLNCLATSSSHMCLLGYANGEPVVFYDSYIRRPLSLQFYEEATEASGRKQAFSTFDLYSRVGIKIGQINQRVVAFNADSRISQLLKISEGAAVLMLESMIQNTDGEAIEYKKAYYRTDKYSFNLCRTL